MKALVTGVAGQLGHDVMNELAGRGYAGIGSDIAEICRELGCKMMYISTDYVFDGLGSEPWTPDCRDYNPF